MKGIVIGGSRGIGKAIASAISELEYKVISTSSSELDTSDINSVIEFCDKNPQTDVLVLNTGGPPSKEFQSIAKEEWERYHNQLFLGFVTMLQRIQVNEGGYIFLISSSIIKEPNAKLIISCAYRAAFSEVFKILSKSYAEKNISCVNIAPGPINTDRTKELIDDIEEYKKTLPMKRLGEPEEIGDLVKSIIQNRIKYLSGVTINFDGANSNSIF